MYEISKRLLNICAEGCTDARMHAHTDGQGKTNMIPTFQSWGIIKNDCYTAIILEHSRYFSKILCVVI